MHVMEAHNQWMSRPDDERFENLVELRRHTRAVRERSVEFSNVPQATIEYTETRGEVIAQAPGVGAVRMTHHAFEQACRAVGAPPSYLRELSAETAARCLTESARSQPRTKTRELLAFNPTYAGDPLVLRGDTSTRYARVWDEQIVDRLEALHGSGWRVPPARPARDRQRGTRPATSADVIEWRNARMGGAEIKVGDAIAPAGLYASAHDLWAIMVSPSHVDVDGSTLWRGMIARHSEVGAASFSLTCFLFDGACGNHILWGVREWRTMRVVHVGDELERWSEMQGALAEWSSRSASLDAEKIAAAQRFMLGGDRDGVVDFLHAKRITSRATAGAAFDLAQDTPRYGDPRSAWAIVCGLTELAQHGDGSRWADHRATLDLAASKIAEEVCS